MNTRRWTVYVNGWNAEDECYDDEVTVSAVDTEQAIAEAWKIFQERGMVELGEVNSVL